MRILDESWLPLWEQVWRRDAEYDRLLDRVSFNNRSAELHWHAAEDDAVEPSELDPETWEEIPPLQHAEHHKIFRQFLSGVSPEITELCNTESIGHFMEMVIDHFGEDGERVVSEWFAFRTRALQQRAAAWLSARGYEANW